MKGATLFSGGGGFCLGMVAAGVEHAWGIEYVDDIAAVARMNGLNTVTADILQCDPADFESVDYLHASPPCPNFSNANTKGEETDLDRALAAKVCEFIVKLQPRIFTLENVYQYRDSKSWETIARTLLDSGYQVNYWHCNFADWGVPQTRKRMIAIARHDGVTPMLPPATHDEKPVQGLFGVKERWVSWYEAIEDLIPTLPDSEFAPWQLERLPDELKESFFTDASNPSRDFTTRKTDEPSTTVVATMMRRPVSTPRAFIVPGGNATSFSVRDADEPVRVIGDVDRVGNIPRAFIVQAGNTQSNGKVVNEVDEPARTVDTSTSTPKAFIVNGMPNNHGADVTICTDEKPAFTTTATVTRHPQRASVEGRVVKMTPRALARFQAFPDSYQLPDNNGLACRIIGNAVPPLFAQRLTEWLLRR